MDPNIQPASRALEIAPSDTDDITTPNYSVVRGLYVGTSGDLKATMAGSNNVIVFKKLAAGIVHPLRVSRVWATGTTAADIVGVY